MSERRPKSGVMCEACEYLSCHQPKNTAGFRVATNIEGEQLEYDEPVVDCLALHVPENEEYMLWVFGWSRFMAPKCYINSKLVQRKSNK